MLYDEFGISSSAYYTTDSDIDVVNTTHEITSVFAPGWLSICSHPQQLLQTSGTFAAGAQTLAEASSTNDRLLVVIEPGGALYDGGTAAGRRVMLPWGNSGGFDFSQLTSDGLTLMQRSIEWAAAPLTAVQVTLEAGQNSPSRVETETQVLNIPGASGS